MRSSTRFFLVLIMVVLISTCMVACTADDQNATKSDTISSTVVSIAVVNTTLENQSVNLSVLAKGMAFNVTTITAPAGANVTISFDNQDNMPHNIAFYESSVADKPIFVGDVITGPKNITYTFTAPQTAGTYFFRCDVHPAKMIGNFVVT